VKSLISVPLRLSDPGCSRVKPPVNPIDRSFNRQLTLAPCGIESKLPSGWLLWLKTSTRRIATIPITSDTGRFSKRFESHAGRIAAPWKRAPARESLSSSASVARKQELLVAIVPILLVAPSYHWINNSSKRRKMRALLSFDAIKLLCLRMNCVDCRESVPLPTMLVSVCQLTDSARRCSTV